MGIFGGKNDETDNGQAQPPADPSARGESRPVPQVQSTVDLTPIAERLDLILRQMKRDHQQRNLYYQVALTLLARDSSSAVESVISEAKRISKALMENAPE